MMTPLDLVQLRLISRDSLAEPVVTHQMSQSLTCIARLSDSSRVFFKSSCVALLQKLSPRNPDAKWQVTLQSFRVEHAHYSSPAYDGAYQVLATRIVDAMGNPIRAADATFESRFLLLAQALEPPAFVEHLMFDEERRGRMLEYLADFHSRPVASHVCWDRGGWWRTPLRPTVKFAALKEVLGHLQVRFGRAFASFEEQFPDWQASADAMASLKQQDLICPRFAAEEARCLVHGDVKSSNFFFNVEQGHVVGFDFQWVGLGKTGLADLVYVTFGSLLPLGSVEVVRREYCEAMARRGVCIDGFDEQWARELVDYFCTAVPYLLGELTPKKMAKNVGKHGFLSYEEDVGVLLGFCVGSFQAWSWLIANQCVVA